jgi:WD40 repeat protein
LIAAHQELVTALVISADGTTAYSASRDGTVKRVVLPSQSEKNAQVTTLLSGNDVVLALALSPDERKLAVAVYSYIGVYDLDSGKMIQRLTKIDGRISALAWDPSGALLAIGRADGDVFVWTPFVKRWSGTDDVDTFDRYEGGSSPIVSLLFHPEGRTLFVAEQNGRLQLWRLLQTEVELGLRDNSAFVDREKRGHRATRIAELNTKIQDVWYDDTRQVLFVAGANGVIYRWKVRGVKLLTEIVVGTDAIVNVVGMSVPISGVASPVLAVSMRGSPLLFFCQGSLKLWYPPANAIPGIETFHPPATVVGRSELFIDELSLLRASSSGVSWAAQKTGSLLVFNTARIAQRPEIQSSFAQCSK